MFKQMRPRVFLFAEVLLPFLMPFLGFPAFCCFMSDAWDAFDLLYDGVLILFIITCLTEIILGFISFILFLVHLFNKNRPPYALAENLILWIASIFFLVNTIFQLLFIAAVTIGQSV